MSKKVSIVVPIYKVEKYLDRCVESLVNQTYSNIEIILVDDESPDRCPEICEEWAKKDERIKVVHKKNAGLGMARNSGIEVMTGDYVTFVDSDDFIEPRTCETAINKIEETGAQACFYDSCAANKNGIAYRENDYSEMYIEGEAVVKDFLLNSMGPDEYHVINTYPVALSSCMALYDTALFKEDGLRFLSEREFINEDLMFRYMLCKYLKSLVIIPDCLYIYYHRSGSLSTSYNPNRFESSVSMYLKGEEVLNGYAFPELNKKNARIFITNVLVCVKHEVLFSKKNGRKECRKNIKNMCENETLHKVLCEYPIDKMELQQRLLFKAMKNKSVFALILLVKLKNATVRIKSKIKR